MMEKGLQYRDEGLDQLDIKYVRCFDDQDLKHMIQMRDWYAYAKTVSLDSFLVKKSLGVFQDSNSCVFCCIVFVY